MKNAFDGFINRLGTTQRAQRQVNGSFHTEEKRKRWEKQQNIQELWDSYKMCSVHSENTRRKKQKKCLNLQGWQKF